ncbi:MAG: hypothetical protein IJ328_07695 [Muribaculaceae bacterium]|nr:hypothetical protein [Muribaculaceae bacterium]
MAVLYHELIAPFRCRVSYLLSVGRTAFDLRLWKYRLSAERLVIKESCKAARSKTLTQLFMWIKLPEFLLFNAYCVLKYIGCFDKEC